MEIERKWLITEKDLPENFKATYSGHRINQGYLNPGAEYLIRVRHNKSIRYPEKNKDTYKMEIKSKGLLMRDEWRFETTEEMFWEIFNKCSRTISKTRYYMMVDKYQYEIDFYDEYEFIVLEIEFDSLEEAENFEVPSWFGEDVTFKLEYKNVNLAQ